MLLLLLLLLLLMLVSSCRLAGPHGHRHSFWAFPCVTHAVLHSRGIARAVFWPLFLFTGSRDGILGAVLCVPITCWGACSTCSNENMLRAEHVFAAAFEQGARVQPHSTLVVQMSGDNTCKQVNRYLEVNGAHVTAIK